MKDGLPALDESQIAALPPLVCSQHQDEIYLVPAGIEIRRQARSRGGGSGGGGRTPPQLPIPKILFHPLAWGPIKVTIPSSYRWKYAPLWLINHPRRLELDSLFLPWYRQPNHTLYIVFHPSKFRPPPPPGWLAWKGLFSTACFVTVVRKWHPVTDWLETVLDFPSSLIVSSANVDLDHM